MAKFEITSPSGKVLEIEGDTPPSEAELDEIFKSVDSGNVEPTSNKKGLDLTPSGLTRNVGNTIGNALATPIISMRDNIPLDQAYQQAQENTQRFNAEEENNPLRKTSDFLTDMAVYSKLPMFNGFKGANALNGLYQGGLIGGLEGLKRGENPLESALGGGAFGAGLNMALPPVLRGATSGINKIASSPAMQNVSSKVKDLLANSIPYLKPETVRQAVKPNSVALDLNENTAQNLLMNTTERVRNAYNNILNKKGNDVGQLLSELPDNVQFKAGDVLGDIDKIYSNYSLSNNPELNPAINSTKKELAKIEDMLYSNGQQNVDEFMQNVEGQKYPRFDLETIKGKKKGQYFTKSLDSMQNNIELAARRFNNDVLGKIQKDPSLLQNENSLRNLEYAMEDITSRLPKELQEEMYTKFYSILGDSEKLNKANYTVSPKELYDINKNISDMTDWGAVDAATKNDVLEQIYGANAERISNLSPKLKDANKVYSDLMDFKKNEGINQILNNREKIDTASSALKNYNSTITKGNTNRNIQDLENILVNEGEQPFLNAIDDVNAAQDLLSTPTTGFNPFGLTNIAKRLTNPALKAVRNYNRNKGNFNPQFKDLPESVKRLLNIGAGMNAPMLYGGISNDDIPY